MELKVKQRIAVSAMFFQSGLCFSSWASRIPEIKQTFHLSEAALGALLLIKPVGSFIGIPLAGFVVDKYGSKYTSLIAVLAYSICLTIIGLAPSVILLGTTLLFFGMAGNLTSISINTQGLNVQNNYGKIIMSSFHGLWSLAGFTGAALGTLVISLNIGIAIHFISVTVTVFLLAFLSVNFLSDDRFKSSNAAKSADNKGRGWAGLKKPDPQLFKLGLVAFCGMMCEGCMFDWSGVYFKEVIGANKGWITVGYIAFMSTMATGRFISDSFANRWGSKTIIIINGVLIFTGLMVAVCFPYLVTGIIGFLLVGAGTSSVVPLTYSEVGKTQNISPGIALAMVTSIGYFGFLLGPGLIGLIAEALSLRASFALIAIVGLTISAMVGYSVRKSRVAATSQV